MAPMNETTDKAYYEGWHDGYMHAIEDIRHELLEIEAGMQASVCIPSIEIYRLLNFMKGEIDNE